MGARKEPDDRVEAPAAAARLGRFRWPALGLAGLVLFQASFILSRFAPAIVGPDANGYWAQGSLLATTGHMWFAPDAACQYIGIHWLRLPSGRYISRYGPGLSVLVGAIYRLLGYKASILISPVLASLSLIGLYLVARRLLPAGWALMTTTVLAMNPVFEHYCLSCDAHMAVMFCVIWGSYFLIRWSRNGRVWECAVGAFLFGAIPTIRYPDSLMIAGAVALLLWHRRRWPGISRHYLAAAAAAAVPLVPLLLRNQLLLGAFWRTGYSLTHEQTGFGWEYLCQHFAGYIRDLHRDGLGPMFDLGVIGIVWLCVMRRLRPLGMMLVLFALPVLPLYMAYYWGSRTAMFATMRFLLPTFPVYLVAGTWVLRRITERASPWVELAVSVGVLSLQWIWGGSDMLRNTASLCYQHRVLADMTAALESTASSGDDVIVSDSTILQHLDFVRHWKLADPTLVRGSAADSAARERAADGPWPIQEEGLRAQRYSGSARDRQQKFSSDVRAWAGGGHVYFVGLERCILGTVESALGGSAKIVWRERLPKLPKRRRSAPAEPGSQSRTGPHPMGIGAARRALGDAGDDGDTLERALLEERQALVIAEWSFDGN